MVSSILEHTTQHSAIGRKTQTKHTSIKTSKTVTLGNKYKKS